MKIRRRQQPANFPSGAQVATLAESEPEAEGAIATEPLDAPAMAEPEVAPPLSPPPVSAEVTVDSSKTPVPRTEPATAAQPSIAPLAPSILPSAWGLYLAAFVVSVLWAGGLIAFAWGYRREIKPFDSDVFALAVFGVLAIGPALFVWFAAYMVRQGQRLSAEAGRAKVLADEMISPALAAGLKAIDVVGGVRDEIGRASAAADEARETLLALRDALAVETEKLSQAAATSNRTAHGLAEALGRERVEMGALSQTLDAQSARVADAITQQARMVSQAADLAETQLRESEATLAARAADLAAAAGEASDAARTAGEDLNRHIARLETAGIGVAEQITSVEQGLTEQRAALVTVAHALRGDHENFAAQAETHTAQLSEFISQARLSAMEMGDRAIKGGEALRELINEASAQFKELTDAAKAERDEFGQSTLSAMEDVSKAAALERARLEEQSRATIEALAQAAEQTRAAAARHAETAREQVDQLSEAAFSAGQKANQVFEDRLAEARELIEQSAQMVEAAGAETARKLDDGAAAARATLQELQGMLAEIEQAAARMPAAARGQADQVRASITAGMDELMEHARRTSEETQAIDSAFQERVRRNYEMLSEAVRLMGQVSAPQALTPAPPQRERPPLRPSRLSRAEPERQPEAEPDLELTDPIDGPAQRAGLRPRLRLTPTATDEEFSSLFESASGRPPAEAPEGDWTWKNLLTSMDDADGEDKAARLEETLISEIAGMGIDPAALLTRGRIEEIAAAVQTRDVDGAREVVRKLAPAATRRLARRLFTDDTLKRQVAAYLARFEGQLDEAAERDLGGFEVAQLLNSEAGRAYLLLDAAAGDLI